MKVPSRHEENVDSWKHLITAGNLGFNVNDFSGAINCYSKSKRVAMRLFEYAQSPGQVVPMLIISYQNLADTYKRNDDLFQAHKELKYIHEFLTDYLNVKQTHSQEMLNAIHRGIGMTQIALFDFLRENPIMRDGNGSNPSSVLHS